MNRHVVTWLSYIGTIVLLSMVIILLGIMRLVIIGSIAENYIKMVVVSCDYMDVQGAEKDVYYKYLLNNITYSASINNFVNPIVWTADQLDRPDKELYTKIKEIYEKHRFVWEEKQRLKKLLSEVEIVTLESKKQIRQKIMDRIKEKEKEEKE